MKKNYIQPSLEVATMKAMYNLLGESTPFEYGGSGTTDTPGQYIEPV
jgi:hypothetical protein